MCTWGLSSQRRSGGKNEELFRLPAYSACFTLRALQSLVFQRELQGLMHRHVFRDQLRCWRAYSPYRLWGSRYLKKQRCSCYLAFWTDLHRKLSFFGIGAQSGVISAVASGRLGSDGGQHESFDALRPYRTYPWAAPQRVGRVCKVPWFFLILAARSLGFASIERR